MKTFSPVILFGWNDTQNFSYGRAYSCALCCTGANAISLSLNKEMAKETRASNSVLMGKFRYPLPKNFASKILPTENKNSIRA